MEIRVSGEQIHIHLTPTPVADKVHPNGNGRQYSLQEFLNFIPSLSREELQTVVDLVNRLLSEH